MSHMRGLSSRAYRHISAPERDPGLTPHFGEGKQTHPGIANMHQSNNI